MSKKKNHHKKVQRRYIRADSFEFSLNRVHFFKIKTASKAFDDIEEFKNFLNELDQGRVRKLAVTKIYFEA